MKAIVYTSNTGSTARYAAILGQETGLPVYSMDEAKRAVPAGAEVLYLGWLMASGIKGYAKAAKRYHVRAVCAVGMGSTGSQLELVREKNAVPAEVPLFTLQGNLDASKLRGVYQLMISIMMKSAGKGLSEKPDRTPEEDDLLDAIQNRRDRICPENLTAVLDWYRTAEKQ